MNSMTSAQVVVSSSRAGRVRDVISLFKLRIGFMIMLTALVGMVVEPGPLPGLVALVTVGLTVLLASASAGAFNQYHEYESDRLMPRTCGRAFVTGAIRRSPWWLVAMGLLLAGSVGTAAWMLNPVSALYVFLGAFFYAVVYTVWLKRRSWLNIVIGGLAGSFAVLAGAAAEFMSGWLALRFNNQADKAFQHFESLYNGTSTPISRSRGAYWAGKASEKLGHGEIAKKWFKESARYQTAFYGQMAIGELDASERPPLLVSRMLGLKNPDDFTAELADASMPAWGMQRFADTQGKIWHKLSVRELLADQDFMNIGG